MHNSNSINFSREAFLHPVNIGFLLSLSLAAFMLSQTPWMPTLIMTVGLGLELLYLGTVPWQSWFRHHIERRQQSEEVREDREKAQFDRLDVAHQKRFLALKRIYDKVGANFRELPGSSRVLTHQLVARMDELLSEYLQLLILRERFNEYLRNASTGALIIEIRSLEKKMSTVHSQQLYEVKKRRLEILKKRLEKLNVAEEKADLCHSRLQTIEDAIQYIYEKSLTMYHPDDFDYQLDEMMSELEETSDYIRQMEEDAVLLSRYDRYTNVDE